MALLWALYLLRQKLQIDLAAAHFNHCLRGEEAQQDEDFVRRFCAEYGIKCYFGSSQVKPGKKGLEAAARDARYAFLKSLPGKIATAHTADDNAETVLMHLVRGTGLKGLGGITPVSGNLIRPMLSVTRQDVLAFLDEYHIPYVTDSTNDTDAFLRNRLRHRVMPLLKQENPKLAQNLSAMALRLRQDEQALRQMSTNSVEILRQMDRAQRSRALRVFLEENGVKEPDAQHIALAESLVFSDKPSAAASFPGGIRICRNYETLERCDTLEDLDAVELPCPGTVTLPQLGLQIHCIPAQQQILEKDSFTVDAQGEVVIRSRQTGDTMRLHGGTKSLKKLFIDEKIPAHRRGQIPVIADEKGVLGVYGIGANLDRLGTQMQIKFEHISQER